MSLEDAGGGATALALQALGEQMTSLLASNHQLHARLGRIEAGLLLDGRCGPSLRDDKQRNAGLMTRGGSGDGSLREGRPGGECFGSTLRSEGRQRTGRDQLGCRGRSGLCTHDDETLEQEGVVDDRGAVEVDDRVACGGSEKRGAVVTGEGEVGGGPLCEALEVEIPPTILTCPSYHSESGRDSTAPAGESSGCSGYASKAFLGGVGTSASPLTPASATPSLTTIKSQGQERSVSGLSDGEKRRASDARQIEDSDNAFGPTTLMGRLKAAAAMQQHRPKKKRRSLMDNPRDSLAGYSVRDMQRNEHMRNHWRETVPGNWSGIALFFLRALLWGPYYPSAKNRMRWDFVMMCTACWACIYTPFAVCFGQEVTSANRLLLGSEVLIQVVFTLDVYVNARTVYYGPQGKLVVEPLHMLLAYASSWLAVDLLAANPLGFLLPLLDATHWSYNILQVMQLVKLVKVIHVIQLPYVMKRVEEFLGWSNAKLVLLFASAYALLHFSACVFFLTSNSYDNRDEDTWISSAKLDDSEIWHTYVAAMYWAMSTMTTVGYGDIVPQHTGERIWCMVGMLVGVTAFAYFMSSVASVAAAMNSHSNRMASQRAELDDFLTNAKIPKDLASRVRRYRYYVMEREYGHRAYNIIQGLSATLRVEVLLYLHSDILSKVPLFHDKSKQFMAYLVSFFKLEFYGPGDVIMEVDDRSDEMYFIGEGRLEVHVPRRPTARSGPTMRRKRTEANGASPGAKGTLTAAPDDVRAQVRFSIKHCASVKDPAEVEEVFVKMGELQTGEFFGEYSCLTGTPRTATVTAVEYSELYSLSKSDLEKMLIDWPEMSAELYSLMDEFVTGLPPPETDRGKTAMGHSVFSVVKARAMASNAKSRRRLRGGGAGMRLKTQSTLSCIERAAAAGTNELDDMVAAAVEEEREEKRKKKKSMQRASRSAGEVISGVLGRLRRGNSEPVPGAEESPNWRSLIAQGRVVRVSPTRDQVTAMSPSSFGTTYVGDSHSFNSCDSDIGAAMAITPVGPISGANTAIGKTQFGL